MNNYRTIKYIRIVCLIMVLILMLLCASCGNSVSTGNSGDSIVPEEKIIAFNAEYVRDNSLLIIEGPEQVQLIDSYEEFMEHVNMLNDRPQPTHEGSTVSPDELKQRYVESWFKDHQLLVIRFLENSSSYRLNVSEIQRAVNKVGVEIDRLIPRSFTCDMAGWEVFIEIERCLPKEVEFDLVISTKGI